MAVEHLEWQGFKLTMQDRSVLLRALSISKENSSLSDHQLIEFSKALGKFSDDLELRSPLAFSRTAITPLHVPTLSHDAAAYKFTKDEAVPFWLAGSIRLHPLTYYHVIENDNARDVREGFGLVSLRSEKREMSVELLSGFNSYVICTSSDARKSERVERHAKFGPRLLRINRANEFAEKVGHLLGASRVVVRDVAYSDSKIVRGESDLADALAEFDVGDEFQMAMFEYLADHRVDQLVEAAEAASAFTKPNHYRVERERRFLFAMDRDVDGSIDVQSDELAEHIELIT
ncbi:hypothetical protein IFT66_10285 [Rhizobium sp. CFBP 13726]|uniref:hypothetical protein n=1 Tax=Rhizobium sp. CFBP 13726 TaxID=2775296 RepID=UPI001786C21B|nr:hypothetical protein [Rhizobium sp. CFBP 13726]MBD8651465.1 hypothetical protein [Rhizobium sp. CFBP 13726]